MPRELGEMRDQELGLGHGGVDTVLGLGPKTPALSRLLHPLGHGPQPCQSVTSVGIIPEWTPHVHLAGWPKSLQCAKFPSRAWPLGGPAGAGTVGP